MTSLNYFTIYLLVFIILVSPLDFKVFNSPNITTANSITANTNTTFNNILFSFTIILVVNVLQGLIGNTTVNL